MKTRSVTTRGITRTRKSMRALVVTCTTEITRELGLRAVDATRVRVPLIVRLRDTHACTFGQISDALGVSEERVCQLYRLDARARARAARKEDPPIHELSGRALRALREAGLEPGASFRDVGLLVPLLRLFAKKPGDPGFNPKFHLDQFGPSTLREIEAWLLRIWDGGRP